ncbi:MAG: endonuclease/exonuclease/phosphatase family protein [Solirubrobacterales bacterium]
MDPGTPTTISLLSWNVAGRVALHPEQAAAVARREPDVVCLQEVRASTAPRWRRALADAGLPHALDSSGVSDGRRLFSLTASRRPLHELAPIGAPQPERVLSALVDSPLGPLELHNAHVPPADRATAGITKIETCEALLLALGRPDPRPGGHRVLCGDLNTPRYESEDGSVVETFAPEHPAVEARWDRAERGLLLGLADGGEDGLVDAFRAVHGYDRRDVSWVMHTRARRKHAHRLDHVLASTSLRVAGCDYIHGWREAGLSDHSAIEATFASIVDAERH